MGFDLDSLLHNCDLTNEMLKQPGARIPIEKLVKLTNLCTTATNDEIVGLLHKPIPIGFFRMMALSALHTRTLGQAMQRSAEFTNLFENSFQQSFVTKDKRAEVIWSRIPGHKILDNYAIDNTIATLHRFMGWLCNERIILNQVKVDFPPPDYAGEYQYLYYGAPVLFNQKYNSISFDRGYLDHRIVQSEASLESYIRRAPLDIYLPLSVGGKFTQTVRKLIKDLFVQQVEPPTLEQISDRLRFNTQALRRRLKDEGTSFHDIKAQVRRDIAIYHLGDPDTSIERIALFAGYTEPSAFIRAFKGWTGFTPLQFRKGLESDRPDDR